VDLKQREAWKLNGLWGNAQCGYQSTIELINPLAVLPSSLGRRQSYRGVVEVKHGDVFSQFIVQRANSAHVLREAGVRDRQVRVVEEEAKGTPFSVSLVYKPAERSAEVLVGLDMTKRHHEWNLELENGGGFKVQ